MPRSGNLINQVNWVSINMARNPLALSGTLFVCHAAIYCALRQAKACNAAPSCTLYCCMPAITCACPSACTLRQRLLTVMIVKGSHCAMCVTA